MKAKLQKISVITRPDYRRQLKNGEYNLMLFVYKSPTERKSYGTNIRVTSEEWDKINSQSSLRTVRRKRELMMEIQTKARRIVDAIQYDFSFGEFEEYMFGIKDGERYDKTDVYATFRIKINRLTKEDRIGSAKVYEYVLSSMMTFRKQLRFHQITTAFLYKYEKFMLDQGCKKSTVGIRMRHLKAIVNMAKEEGVVTSLDYPFGRRSQNKYEIPSSRNPKRAISSDDLRRIIEFKSTERDEWARDMWLLSFYCNGMNMTDVFNLRWRNVDQDFLYFVRQKTKNMCRKEEPVEIFLTDEAKQIINRWAISDRKRKDAYLFGVFEEYMDEEERLKANRFALRVVNTAMKKIAKELGIENRITTMVARHTWATILMHNGVPIPYISKGLGHTSVLTTENYLADFEQQYKRDIGSILSSVTNGG